MSSTFQICFISRGPYNKTFLRPLLILIRIKLECFAVPRHFQPNLTFAQLFLPRQWDDWVVFTLWRKSLKASAFFKCRKYFSVLEKALALSDNRRCVNQPLGKIVLAVWVFGVLLWHYLPKAAAAVTPNSFYSSLFGCTFDLNPRMVTTVVAS